MEFDSNKIINIDFSGKKIFVIGATGGIGKITAAAFSLRKGDVILGGRRLDNLKQTQEEFEAKGLNAKILQVDLTSSESIQNAVAQFLAQYGDIDILINSAGVAFTTRMELTTESEWDSTMDTNLKGYFFIIKEFLPNMRARGKAKIINLASIAGKIGVPNAGVPYTASKAGVIMMTRELAKRFGHYGIRINAICPGLIDTERIRQWQKSIEIETEPFQSNYLKRLGTTYDVANLILFLSSEFASAIHGQAINVDGGTFAF